MQHKRPLDAMSTYLNGFHIYADEMGRMVEATHPATDQALTLVPGYANWCPQDT